jgi:hypothetical protein
LLRRLWQCRIGFGNRQRHVGLRELVLLLDTDHRINVRGAAIDLKLKDVGAIVVPGEIVPQLHADAEIEIAIGIEDAFFGAHRTGDDLAVGSDDHAAAATVGVAQEALALGAWLKLADDILVHRAASRNDKGFAHLRESL